MVLGANATNAVVLGAHANSGGPVLGTDRTAYTIGVSTGGRTQSGAAGRRALLEVRADETAVRARNGAGRGTLDYYFGEC